MKRLEITQEISDLQVRAAGDGPGHFTMRGHAAVFGRLSENLGGFRERIAPGAFSGVLERSPDVRLLVDHQPSSVMARTTNKTLELREDPHGLHAWARIPSDLSSAQDLRVRMETGLVNQMSFAFTIDR
jgi:HK97 family phage prohead protease